MKGCADYTVLLNTTKHLIMRNKNIPLTFLAICILGITLAVTIPSGDYNDMKDIEEVTSLVESAYINGAFNALDTKAMKNGFHEDFAIFSASGETLNKYPIGDWIAGIEKRKAAPDFQPQTWEHKFPQIDITGNSASVKVELFKEGKHIYTDYLSLLKFDSGWKIVAKVYYMHADL